MVQISAKKLQSLRSRASSRIRKRVTRKGVKRAGIISARSFGRAALFNVERKISTRVVNLGRWHLPVDMIVVGTASKALKQGGDHFIKSGIEILMSRGIDMGLEFVSGGGGGNGSGILGNLLGNGQQTTGTSNLSNQYTHPKRYKTIDTYA